MTNIILSGSNGRMGQAISRLAEESDNCRIVCGFDINTKQLNDYPVYDNYNDFDGSADVIIDFSNPANFEKLMAYATGKKLPVVVCTTGLSKEQIALLAETSKVIPLFYSANMSLGVNLIIELASRAAKLLEGSFDIEIIEKHHNQKLDAPSGTALAIADAISESLENAPEYVYDRHSVRKKREPNEIGIHAVRGGTIVGEHSVIFAGNNEVIELNHSATSREVFAVGAIRAGIFLANKPVGMYSMKDLVNEMA